VKVLMSATTPAPPEGSKPAMVNATGIVFGVCIDNTVDKKTFSRKGAKAESKRRNEEEARVKEGRCSLRLSF